MYKIIMAMRRVLGFDDHGIGDAVNNIIQMNLMNPLERMIDMAEMTLDELSLQYQTRSFDPKDILKFSAYLSKDFVRDVKTYEKADPEDMKGSEKYYDSLRNEIDRIRDKTAEHVQQLRRYKDMIRKGVSGYYDEIVKSIAHSAVNNKKVLKYLDFEDVIQDCAMFLLTKGWKAIGNPETYRGSIYTNVTQKDFDNIFSRTIFNQIRKSIRDQKNKLGIILYKTEDEKEIENKINYIEDLIKETENAEAKRNLKIEWKELRNELRNMREKRRMKQVDLNDVNEDGEKINPIELFPDHNDLSLDQYDKEELKSLLVKMKKWIVSNREWGGKNKGVIGDMFDIISNNILKGNGSQAIRKELRNKLKNKYDVGINENDPDSEDKKYTLFNKMYDRLRDAIVDSFRAITKLHLNKELLKDFGIDKAKLSSNVISERAFFLGNMLFASFEDDGFVSPVEMVEGLKAKKASEEVSNKKIASHLLKLAKEILSSLKYKQIDDKEGKRWSISLGDYNGTIQEIEGPSIPLYRILIAFPDGKAYKFKKQVKKLDEAKKIITKTIEQLNGDGSVTMRDWVKV